VALLIIILTMALTAAVWTPMIHEVDLEGKRAALLGCWRTDKAFAARVNSTLAPLVAPPGLHFHRISAPGRTVWFFHLRLGRLRWLGGWTSA
jgi:hypothetical protein